MTALYKPYEPWAKPNPEHHRALTPASEQIFKGKYVEVLRSEKGKIKGLYLQQGQQVYPIKLPKYLRPMLVRELTLGDLIKVWVYPNKNIWKAIKIAPLSSIEIAKLSVAKEAYPESAPSETGFGTAYLPLSSPQLDQTQASPLSKPCLRIQVCRKGSCHRQGSEHIWQTLQTEIASHSNCQEVVLEKTGCLKACKQGPNIRILPSGKVLSRVSPEGISTLFSQGHER